MSVLFSKNSEIEARETVQKLRADVLAEDLGLIPRTHMAASFRESEVPFLHGEVRGEDWRRGGTHL